MRISVAFILGVTFIPLTAARLLAGDPLAPELARKKLEAGALLVDVRTQEEFRSNKLPGAINIPLDTIATGITHAVTNKSQAVLLHCRSGRRSAQAEAKLRSLGYTNVFNLGSFDQAARVVPSRPPAAPK